MYKFKFEKKDKSGLAGIFRMGFWCSRIPVKGLTARLPLTALGQLLLWERILYVYQDPLHGVIDVGTESQRTMALVNLN